MREELHVVIKPSFVQGMATVLPSKSITQRTIAAAVLTKGSTIIKNPSYAADVISALQIAQRFGASITYTTNAILINGNFHVKLKQILCGESGLAMRMFAPIAALAPQQLIFDGIGTLLKRPAKEIKKTLQQGNVKIKLHKGNFLPLAIQGPISGGTYHMNASQSSQILTGLLMALPLAPNNSSILVQDLKSKPYIDLTIDLLEKFGIEIQNSNYERFEISGKQVYKQSVTIDTESDWSAAAFLLVAAAINGKIELQNLNIHSKQADAFILEVLKKSNAGIEITENSIHVWSNPLLAFEFDATHCPDLFPPLAALAAHCSGISIIKGVNRLINKESNRSLTIQTTLQSLGIDIEIKNNEMHIRGGKISGGAVNPHNDHRIAMMATLLGLKSERPINIADADCVKKSFPDFFIEMKRLGVAICFNEKS